MGFLLQRHIEPLAAWLRDQAREPAAYPLGRPVERLAEWLRDHGQAVFGPVSALIIGLIGLVQWTLELLPVWLWSVLVVSATTWRIGWRFGAGASVALAAIVWMGLWDSVMSTLALVLTSTVLSLGVGLCLGVWAARSDAVDRGLQPLLNAAQAMPVFVYLIPAVMFFRLGKASAVVATVIFATPPVVRLTNLGIRQVPRDAIRAGRAFGCSELQLVTKVQLPIALPSIMVGVNQTILLALSMVIIASMIGAGGGLGDGVRAAIERFKLAPGFEAGIAAVLLAIGLDRLAQSLATDRPRTWREHRPRGLVGIGGFSLCVAMALGYVVAADLWREPTPAARGAAATPESDRPCALRVGTNDSWADADFVTTLAADLLQQHFGCAVERASMPVALQYKGLASGDIDLILLAWLPAAHGAEHGAVADAVVDFGALYTGARLGWAVPVYAFKAGLRSIEQLRDPAVQARVGSRILGIDHASGLMRQSREALRRYGLHNLELVSANGASMAVEVERALRRRRWVVFTAWNPHWLFAATSLHGGVRYLDDPEGVFSHQQRVHALARTGFDQDVPKGVIEFLTRLWLPLGELELALMYAKDHSTGDAVDHYIRNHPTRVHYWLFGEP